VARWNGRQIAVGEDAELAATTPRLLVVQVGDPSVVLLGSPRNAPASGHYLKLILLGSGPDGQSVVSTVYTIGDREVLTDTELDFPGLADPRIEAEGFILWYGADSLTVDVANWSPEDRGHMAAMKSDLRNLLTQEETRKIDSGSYVTSFPPTIWSTSAGVTGPTITLTADGWTASVGHVSSPRTCAIFVGSTPLAPASQEGVPTCTP
jgi:hypothetical protein